MCISLGLEDGNESEAFNSKRSYALKRLSKLDSSKLITVGKSLSERMDYHPLDEVLHKLDGLNDIQITKLTRTRLLKLFDNVSFTTEREDIDLIRDVWPIAQMHERNPYGHPRTMEEAIFQHTIRNGDWSNKQLLEELGFDDCSQTQVFKFLEAITHPLANEPQAQTQLVSSINEIIQHDGFKLIESGRISGTPYYTVQKINAAIPAADSISSTLSAFNEEDIHKGWQSALAHQDSDPRRAITLARTLLEDVCKYIITEAGQAYAEKDDLPVLYKRLSSILNLAPDSHTEQIFKQILGSCQSIVESLGSLRNKLSDAHSIGPLRAKPLPRHAELAVNLSGTMALFLIHTWNSRKSATPA